VTEPELDDEAAAAIAAADADAAEEATDVMGAAAGDAA
jgi:hypothetical protein